jgi:cell division inhibitor SulA
MAMTSDPTSSQEMSISCYQVARTESVLAWSDEVTQSSHPNLEALVHMGDAPPLTLLS